MPSRAHRRITHRGRSGRDGVAPGVSELAEQAGAFRRECGLIYVFRVRHVGTADGWILLALKRPAAHGLSLQWSRNSSRTIVLIIRVTKQTFPCRWVCVTGRANEAGKVAIAVTFPLSPKWGLLHDATPHFALGRGVRRWTGGSFNPRGHGSTRHPPAHALARKESVTDHSPRRPGSARQLGVIRHDDGGGELWIGDPPPPSLPSEFALFPESARESLHPQCRVRRCGQ